MHLAGPYSGSIREALLSKDAPVLVCHCKVVNEAHVREAIANGARDEADVAAACGAGTGCGGCTPIICRLLRECAAAGIEDEPAAGIR